MCCPLGPLGLFRWTFTSWCSATSSWKVGGFHFLFWSSSHIWVGSIWCGDSQRDCNAHDVQDSRRWESRGPINGDWPLKEWGWTAEPQPTCYGHEESLTQALPGPGPGLRRTALPGGSETRVRPNAAPRRFLAGNGPYPWGGGGGQKRRSEPEAGRGRARGGGGRHYCVGGLAGLGLRESLSAGGRRPPLPRRRQRRQRRQLTQPAARAETPLTARGFPVPAPGARGTRPLPPRHWPLRPPPHTYWPVRRQSAEAAGAA